MWGGGGGGLHIKPYWMLIRTIVRATSLKLWFKKKTFQKISDISIHFRLCQRDPHQLFLRLESQVREFVIEMKVKLLKQLSTGLKTPPQAKKFISLLLEEYAHLCKVARKMSGLLVHLVS